MSARLLGAKQRFNKERFQLAGDLQSGRCSPVVTKVLAARMRKLITARARKYKRTTRKCSQRPFDTPTNTRLFTVILPKKECLRSDAMLMQCVSFLIGSVGGRFRMQLQPCGWERIKFCRLHFYMLPSVCENEFLIYPGNALLPFAQHIQGFDSNFSFQMWMLQQPKTWNRRL